LASLINDKFHTILYSKDYAEVLKVFSEKGLSSSIGGHFGVNNKEYCELVLRLLQRGNESISIGMKRYLPDL
ncbi:TPA: ABC transporter ATP-binding protein, partial [Bacillus thuringiensis]|nr:ABC transporter ATP-binding protein [Bacillus thuringiensis]